VGYIAPQPSLNISRLTAYNCRCPLPECIHLAFSAYRNGDGYGAYEHSSFYLTGSFLSGTRTYISPSAFFAIVAPLLGYCAGHFLTCSHTSNLLPSSRPGSATATSSFNTAPTCLAARFPCANSSTSSPFLGRIIRPPTRQN